MLLESFKPEYLSTTREQLIAEMKQVERELEGYTHILNHVHDPVQRRELEEKRNQLARRGQLLYARLKALGTVRYHEDPDAIWKRTLQVA